MDRTPYIVVICVFSKTPELKSAIECALRRDRHKMFVYDDAVLPQHAHLVVTSGLLLVKHPGVPSVHVALNKESSNGPIASVSGLPEPVTLSSVFNTGSSAYRRLIAQCEVRETFLEARRSSVSLVRELNAS